MLWIGLFGSPELNDAFRDFSAKWAAFLANAALFRRAREGRADEAGAGMDMHNARQEAAEGLREIERMIREELDAL